MTDFKITGPGEYVDTDGRRYVVLGRRNRPKDWVYSWVISDCEGCTLHCNDAGEVEGRPYRIIAEYTPPVVRECWMNVYSGKGIWAEGYFGSEQEASEYISLPLDGSIRHEGILHIRQEEGKKSTAEFVR